MQALERLTDSHFGSLQQLYAQKVLNPLAGLASPPAMSDGQQHGAHLFLAASSPPHSACDAVVRVCIPLLSPSCSASANVAPTHANVSTGGDASWPLRRVRVTTRDAQQGERADPLQDWWARHVLGKTFIECRSFAMIFR